MVLRNKRVPVIPCLETRQRSLQVISEVLCYLGQTRSAGVGATSRTRTVGSFPQRPDFLEENLTILRSTSSLPFSYFKA
jgi:hypothetical protein